MCRTSRKTNLRRGGGYSAPLPHAHHQPPPPPQSVPHDHLHRGHAVPGGDRPTDPYRNANVSGFGVGPSGGFGAEPLGSGGGYGELGLQPTEGLGNSLEEADPSVRGGYAPENVQLRAERARLEALSLHQAQELERLRARGGEQLEREVPSHHDSDGLRAELEAAKQEQRRLEEKLHAALQASERSEEAHERLEALRIQRDGLQEELGEAQERLEALEQQVAASTGTSEELRRRERELERSRDELEGARRELERNRRLVEELEGRARQLVAEVEGLQTSRSELEARLAREVEDARELQGLARSREASIRDLSHKVQLAAQELAVREEEIDELRSERDGALERVGGVQDVHDELRKLEEQRAREAAEGEALRAERDAQKEAVRDLHNEVEGLKRRFRMERDRHRDQEREQRTEVERLAKEAVALERLRPEHDALQQAYQASTEEVRELRLQLTATVGRADETPGVNGAMLMRLIEHLRAFDRVMNALERADFSSLGTIPKVRLETAIAKSPSRPELENTWHHLGRALTDVSTTEAARRQAELLGEASEDAAAEGDAGSGAPLPQSEAAAEEEEAGQGEDDKDMVSSLDEDSEGDVEEQSAPM